MVYLIKNNSHNSFSLHFQKRKTTKMVRKLIWAALKRDTKFGAIYDSNPDVKNNTQALYVTV